MVLTSYALQFRSLTDICFKHIRLCRYVLSNKHQPTAAVKRRIELAEVYYTTKGYYSYDINTEIGVCCRIFKMEGIMMVLQRSLATL